MNEKEIKKITYKNKELDNNGDVISEQKVNLVAYIKECNIKITEEYDVKKAFELIEKRYNL